MINRSVSYAEDFENEVVSFINDNLSRDEKCLYGNKAFIELGKTRYYPDALLPKGCRALDLHENSIVEVKYQIRFDTVYRLQSLFQNIYDEDKGKKYKFIIIYHHTKVLLPKIKEGFIKIFSAEEFFSKKPKKDNGVKIEKQAIKCRAKYKDYKEAFSHGNCTLFIGAGVSISAGLPSWEGLLFKLGENINKGMRFECKDKSSLERAFSNSSLVEARYLKEQLKQNIEKSSPERRNEFEQEYLKQVRKALYSSINKEKGALIDAIAELVSKTTKVKRIITYNFDDLLQNAIIEKKIIETQAIYNRNSHIEDGYLPILYVHGIIPQCDESLICSEMVLSEDAYHDLYNQPYSWANTEQVHALQSSTCFFIGMSMSDPNLRRLLEVTTTSDNALHYAFLPARDFCDGSSSYPQKELIELMFLDLGVQVVWYDEYKDLPGILYDMIKE